MVALEDVALLMVQTVVIWLGIISLLAFVPDASCCPAFSKSKTHQ